MYCAYCLPVDTLSWERNIKVLLGSYYIRTGPIIRTVLISGGLYSSFSLLHYSSYYTYCLKTKWIVLLIFITVLLFLLHTIYTVLKKQARNIYKYWSYDRNLRVKVHKTLPHMKFWNLRLIISRDWSPVTSDYN